MTNVNNGDQQWFIDNLKRANNQLVQMLLSVNYCAFRIALRQVRLCRHKNGNNDTDLPSEVTILDKTHFYAAIP